MSETAAKAPPGPVALPASVLEGQVQGLLELVERRREQRTGEICAQRDAQVREILRTAKAEARESLHQAVARERARMSQGVRQAEARAELETRQRAQRETLTLLRQMWDRAAAALESRWSAGRQRSAWLTAAVCEAGRLFPERSWSIEHAAGLGHEEQSRAEAQALDAGAREISWQLAPQLRAGLRVRTSGACLDASVAGLLAQRADIEARFLCEYVLGRLPDPSAAAASPAAGVRP
ncbi:MAG TPA: hypothetical protein VMT66_16425 [Steroidobacteraceae bacterium]|nr:hypothetical protein [Steroidobacteraceae bacterium]